MLERSLWPEKITIQKAAEISGLSESTLFKWLKEGKLPPMRDKGAFGRVHWLASDLTEDMLTIQIKTPCPQCNGRLKRRGGAGVVKYYACTSCDYHCKHIAESGEWVRTGKESENPWPACDCGGKIGKSSFSRQSPKKYAKCKSCGQAWKMDINTGEVCKSQPRTAKPKQPKAKPVAKTIRQDYTEKLKEMRDKKARQLVGKVEVKVSEEEKLRRQRIADMKFKQEQRALDNSLYGWD